MSKAAQIRDLIDWNMTNREIADQIDASIDYVRAVRGRYLRPEVEQKWRAEVATARPWYPSNRYRTDAAYRQRFLKRAREYRKEKYHTDPGYRERELERGRRWYHANKSAPEGQQPGRS